MAPNLRARAACQRYVVVGATVVVVNRDTGNTTWDAYYLSGVNDPPGIVGFQCRALNTGQFSITSNNLAATGTLTLTSRSGERTRRPSDSMAAP